MISSASRPSRAGLACVAMIAAWGLLGHSKALAQDDTQEATFQAQALTAHNTYRALLTNTPALSLASATDPLNTGSHDWALHLAQTGVLEHSNSMGAYGENIAVAYDTNNLSPDAVANKAVASWFSESANYDYMKPGFSASTGHFTQVVWVSTTTLGCGYAIGTAVIDGTSYNAFYSVCRYTPAGNVAGNFPDNVQPPVPGKSTP